MNDVNSEAKEVSMSTDFLITGFLKKNHHQLEVEFTYPSPTLPVGTLRSNMRNKAIRRSQSKARTFLEICSVFYPFSTFFLKLKASSSQLKHPSNTGSQYRQQLFHFPKANNKTLLLSSVLEHYFSIGLLRISNSYFSPHIFDNL